MVGSRSLVLLVGLLLAVGCGDDDGPGADGSVAGDTSTGGGDGGNGDGGGGSDACIPMGAENQAGECNDGIDNDCDGFIDCPIGGAGGDPGCDPVCAMACTDPGDQGPENSAARCMDGCDNDDNSFQDCNDNKCSGLAGCPAAERSNVACSDGINNDQDGPDPDGFVDCNDRDCVRTMDGMRVGFRVCVVEMTPALCTDGMDNDGDDLPDCMDPDCHGDAITACDGTTEVAEAERDTVEARCTDGVNNSGESINATDCNDFSCQFFFAGCANKSFENTNFACSDGMDNDLDGLTDCDDPGCSGEAEGMVVCDGERNEVAGVFGDMAATIAAANAECTNTMSDDDNTFVDCADFGCSQDDAVSACDATTEGNSRTCSDGLNNDGNMSSDGTPFADCTDNRCSANPTFCPDNENSFTECSDGLDNDFNGFVDCRDRNCENNVACRESMRPEGADSGT